jgi:hypothetical protein
MLVEKVDNSSPYIIEGVLVGSLLQAGRVYLFACTAKARLHKVVNPPTVAHDGPFAEAQVIFSLPG